MPISTSSQKLPQQISSWSGSYNLIRQFFTRCEEYIEPAYFVYYLAAFNVGKERNDTMEDIQDTEGKRKNDRGHDQPLLVPEPG